MTHHQVLAVILGVGSVAAWVALYWLALLVTRPARPEPVPATQDLPGDEPPAVVSLLANRWELTEDAAESTLLDLAARRYLEFRQPGNDPVQTTVHVRDPNPAGLTGYERRIFDRVAALAVDGVVPLTALTFRDQAKATAFEKRLHADIVADARARGLSRRRFSPPVLAALSLAAVLAGGGVAVAVALGSTRHDVRGVFFAWLFATAFLGAFTHRPIGERDTPAGVEACSRWLGVQTWLRRTEAFADLPPAAVAVWDRYLSYGDALGTARVCAAVIDLGMGNRKRVWSSHGGTWHQVRVRYPSFWRRYGMKARSLITKAVLAGGVGFALLYFSGRVPRFTAPARLVGGVLFAYGAYLLIRTVIDLATPVTVTGQVLWLQVWKSSSRGENSPPQPYLHYLAIDDGTDDRTVAWGLPTNLSHQCADGDTVTIHARRWTRRVLTLTMVEHGTMRRADAVDVTDPAGAAPVPNLTTDLLSVDEVGRALGFPVTVRPAVTPVVRMTQFVTAQGRPALLLMASGGLAGQLALRARRRYQALPGIGDEAYTGEGWAVGRRGDTVIMLTLSEAGRAADPRNLWWLLSTAVGRLPTPGPAVPA